MVVWLCFFWGLDEQMCLEKFIQLVGGGVERFSSFSPSFHAKNQGLPPTFKLRVLRTSFPHLLALLLLGWVEQNSCSVLPPYYSWSFRIRVISALTWSIVRKNGDKCKFLTRKWKSSSTVPKWGDFYTLSSSVDWYTVIKVSFTFDLWEKEIFHEGYIWILDSL